MAVCLEEPLQEDRNLQGFFALLQVARLVHGTRIAAAVPWVQHYIALAGRVLRCRTGGEGRRREKARREDRGQHRCPHLQELRLCHPPNGLFFLVDNPSSDQPPKSRAQKPRLLRAFSSASRRTRSSTRLDFSSTSSRRSWIRRSRSDSSLTFSSSRVEMVLSCSSRWNSTRLRRSISDQRRSISILAASRSLRISSMWRLRSSRRVL